MRFKRMFVLVLVIMLMLPMSVQAKSVEGGRRAPGCWLPESNSVGLVILNNYYPGYWWDHTTLTVAVQAHPSATPAQLDAIHGAIATWSAIFDDCFDGQISVTDSTGSNKSKQKAADIVVHYVPTAGGVVFGGYAICGDHGCPNIMVRSDLPPSLNRPPYDPEYLGWVTLHELGHAFGLGHSTNLLESTDIMGYGWPDLGDPVISDCDIDALRFVFAWVFDGSTAPHEPAQGPYDCSLD